MSVNRVRRSENSFVIFIYSKSKHKLAPEQIKSSMSLPSASAQKLTSVSTMDTKKSKIPLPNSPRGPRIPRTHQMRTGPTYAQMHKNKLAHHEAPSSEMTLKQSGDINRKSLTDKKKDIAIPDESFSSGDHSGNCGKLEEEIQVLFVGKTSKAKAIECGPPSTAPSLGTGPLAPLVPLEVIQKVDIVLDDQDQDDVHPCLCEDCEDEVHQDQVASNTTQAETYGTIEVMEDYPREYSYQNLHHMTMEGNQGSYEDLVVEGEPKQAVKDEEGDHERAIIASEGDQKQDVHQQMEPLSPMARKRKATPALDATAPISGMEVASVVVLREKNNRFSGQLQIKNHTDQYLACMILSNINGHKKYFATPSVNCIPPNSKSIVQVSVIEPHYTNFLAKGDRFILYGIGLSRKIEDSTALLNYLRRMRATYPTIGERAMVTPILVEMYETRALEGVLMDDRFLKYKESLIWMCDKNKNKLNFAKNLNQCTIQFNQVKRMHREIVVELRHLLNFCYGGAIAMALMFVTFLIFPLLMQQMKDQTPLPQWSGLMSEPENDEGLGGLWTSILHMFGNMFEYGSIMFKCKTCPSLTL